MKSMGYRGQREGVGWIKDDGKKSTKKRKKKKREGTTKPAYLCLDKKLQKMDSHQRLTWRGRFKKKKLENNS